MNWKLGISRKSGMALGGLTLIVSLALPAAVRAQESGFSGRVWGGVVGRYVLTDNEPFASPGFGTVGLQVKGAAFGVGGDVEYRLNRWVGIDGAIAYSKLNVQFTSTSAPDAAPTQGFGVLPLLVALNVHLVRSDHADIWAGPQVGYVMFPDDLSYVTSAGTFRYAPKSTFSGAGFVIGADIKLLPSTALNFAARWQNADGDSAGNLTVDPTFVTIGLTRRF